MAVKKTPKKKEEPAPPTKVEATESTPKKAARPKARKDAVAAAPAPEPAPEAKPTKARAKAPAAKASEAKAPEPKAAAKPAAKAPGPKAAAQADAKTAPTKATAKAAGPKAPAKKAVAPIKLTDSQSELLKRIGESTDAGYSIGKKIEQRSIDALLERKLIKKGAKDKASGTPRYQISSAGKKHLSP